MRPTAPGRIMEVGEESIQSADEPESSDSYLQLTNQKRPPKSQQLRTRSNLVPSPEASKASIINVVSFPLTIYDNEAEFKTEAESSDQSTAAATEIASRTPQAGEGGGQEEEPWYLQEEAPRHPSLIQDSQPLPEVPDNVPLILHELVQYAAEDMGLDNLKLLDLRTLDPPAALGPNLIMLFGTARSERHLHVSGRHLVSWLRRKGIQSHADGLLGPNEFKIKMRRKQRKAKLLGTAAMPMGRDDGITTRWICTNLGTIPSGTQQPIEYETATGFGTRQDGTTIVVQALTESKRNELDLELLWSRILARRGDDNLIADDLEYTEADTHPNELSLFTEGEQSKLALEVLNVMHERGEPIVTTDVMVSLIESLARTESQGNQTSELQTILEKFLLQADLPYAGEDAIMRLMDAYAAQDNWTRFWEVWRMPARPVLEVKDALEACLQVADPQAEQIAKHLVVKDHRTKMLSMHEFIMIYRLLNPGWVMQRT
ncbi:putative atpase synthesis protein mitochondrial [Diaporthe ampelina]|uniref:ATPase synthesis protein 25 n=1 Tax=Diaporthe ampelina TaxID=1214573 RepID=A0A0G2FUT4_9PEZI|nr:putative atpase synthesis protein mitochondrial [Diaporthe ampelina]